MNVYNQTSPVNDQIRQNILPGDILCTLKCMHTSIQQLHEKKIFFWFWCVWNYDNLLFLPAAGGCLVHTLARVR